MLKEDESAGAGRKLLALARGSAQLKAWHLTGLRESITKVFTHRR